MEGNEKGSAVRPAGAPMVSVEPPSWAHSRQSSPTGSHSPAAEVVGQAREAGSEIVAGARERARTEVGRRSTWAGERVTAMAGDTREVADMLRQKGKETPARLADDAAERIEAFGTYLQESDTDRIIADARGFARRQPAAVVAGAAAIGLAVGRLLKASSPDSTWKDGDRG
jgi:hypothetical protein